MEDILKQALAREPYPARLRRENKPVILYGMGNGAERIAACLHREGIRIDGVFASDGFVRGQNFLGFPVLTQTEAEARFGDFTAVLCFALEGEKMCALSAVTSRHLLLAPNCAPYGDTAADSAYYATHTDEIERVWNWLADDASRALFASLLAYNLSALPSDLIAGDGNLPDIYYRHGKCHIDIGAFDGTSVLEYLALGGSPSSVLALEPDGGSFARLQKNCADIPNLTCLNAAAWESDTTLSFEARHSRGSSRGGETEVCARSIDSLCADKTPVGSLHIDGEGCDLAILCGAANVIWRDSPAVCIAVYHRAEDLLSLPVWLHRQQPNYRFLLRRKPYLPAFDVFLTAFCPESEK